MPFYFSLVKVTDDNNTDTVTTSGGFYCGDVSLASYKIKAFFLPSFNNDSINLNIYIYIYI
jgi:hypothetical protein